VLALLAALSMLLLLLCTPCCSPCCHMEYMLASPVPLRAAPSPCCVLLVLCVLSSPSRPVLLLVLLLAQDLGECASLRPDDAGLL
jgi:hypothetical protein